METAVVSEAPIKEPPSCGLGVDVGCAPKGAMQLWVMKLMEWGKDVLWLKL